jgi:predicted RecA/RadA family phage recombinase
VSVKGFNPVLRETFEADVAVTQFAALVQGSADYHATLPSGQNADKFVGVALDDANPGQTVPVAMMGTVWMIAAGAINAGDKLIIANAQGQVQSVGSTQNPNIIGTALSSATAAGDLVLVKVDV